MAAETPQPDGSAADAIDEELVALRRRARWRRRFAWGAGILVALSSAWWAHDLSRRYDEREAACAESCEARGRCHPRWSDVIHARPGPCIATSQADCTTACRRSGLCHFDHEGCAAVTEEHCRQSEACRDEGECHLLRAGDVGWNQRTGRGLGGPTVGVCAIHNDDDCRQSRACLDHGRCLVGEDACVTHR